MFRVRILTPKDDDLFTHTVELLDAEDDVVVAEGHLVTDAAAAVVVGGQIETGLRFVGEVVRDAHS